MHIAAKIYWGDCYEYFEGKGLPTAEDALIYLDYIAEDFHGTDAEFDDHTMPDQPLGRLIAIAFNWKLDKSIDEWADDDFDAWYDGPYKSFRQRYNFC